MNALQWPSNRIDLKASRVFALRVVLLAILFILSLNVHAGLSPQNVMVVVNADNPDSIDIAQVYMQLRQIPQCNRIDLSGVPAGLVITQPQFIDSILKPVLKKINDSGLAAQTKVIAYSSGFPTSVNIDEDLQRSIDSPVKVYQRPIASLTGLTYLYQMQLTGDPNYLGMLSNLYVRGDFERHFINPFLLPEQRQRFDAADADRKAEQWADAAVKFRKLANEFKTVAPLAILAAECFVKAGDDSSAKEAIAQAIQSGWTSGSYLRQNESLAKLVAKEVWSRLDNNDLMVAQGPTPFEATAAYLGNGWPVPIEQSGVRYMMSVMLAVIHERGSTKEKAIEVLKRAAKSEVDWNPAERANTQFWFTHTADVRTTTRFPFFADALLAINHLGMKTQVLQDANPKGPGRLMGLMLGTPVMDFGFRQWEFMPGAISENLTSLSGEFSESSQTKITELLHAGAALTCGPVTEPFTLPPKFPLPMTYAYYASGATAIEALYLGLGNPYQTLIVGDPLCQPMANPPQEKVVQLTDGNKLTFQRTSATLTPIDPQFASQQNSTAAIEIYVNGILKRVVPPVATLNINRAAADDEVVLILVGSDPMRSRTVAKTIAK